MQILDNQIKIGIGTYSYIKFEFLTSQQPFSSLVLFNSNKVVLKYLSENKN